MSAQITDIAAALNVPAADIVAIVNQLSDIDYDDTVDTNRAAPAGDVVHCPDGEYENVYLTQSATAALFDQFNGDPAVLAEKYGISV